MTNLPYSKVNPRTHNHDLIVLLTQPLKVQHTLLTLLHTPKISYRKGSSGYHRLIEQLIPLLDNHLTERPSATKRPIYRS